MPEEKISTVTNLQKDLLIKHFSDMQLRLGLITEETSCLDANIKAMKMILGENR